MNTLADVSFPPALAHDAIEEVFPDLFAVRGAMETVLMDLDWQFSRNMIIVREGDRLILINSVRLNEQGLAQLDQLGKVTDVVRLGALHDRDDAFYLDRYKAHHWIMPGLESAGGASATTMKPNGPLPFAEATLFQFETTACPEGVIRLDREGGILIACDALQNWLKPDEHFCDNTRERMQGMGFFTPANVGPVWMQAAQPDADDFNRLRALEFRHVVCGHGEPMLDNAREAFGATFDRLFPG